MLEFGRYPENGSITGGETIHGHETRNANSAIPSGQSISGRVSSGEAHEKITESQGRDATVQDQHSSKDSRWVNMLEGRPGVKQIRGPVPREKRKRGPNSIQAKAQEIEKFRKQGSLQLDSEVSAILLSEQSWLQSGVVGWSTHASAQEDNNDDPLWKAAKAWTNSTKADDDSHIANARYHWNMALLYKMYQKGVDSKAEVLKAHGKRAMRGKSGDAPSMAKLDLFRITCPEPEQAQEVLRMCKHFKDIDREDNLSEEDPHGPENLAEPDYLKEKRLGFASKYLGQFKKKLEYASRWHEIEESFGGEAIWLATLGFDWPRRFIEQECPKGKLGYYAEEAKKSCPGLMDDCEVIRQVLVLKDDGRWDFVSEGARVSAAQLQQRFKHISVAELASSIQSSTGLVLCEVDDDLSQQAHN